MANTDPRMDLIALRNAYEKNPKAFSDEELSQIVDAAKKYGVDFPVKSRITNIIGTHFLSGLDASLFDLIPDSLIYGLVGKPITPLEKSMDKMSRLLGVFGGMTMAGPWVAKKALGAAAKALAKREGHEAVAAIAGKLAKQRTMEKMTEDIARSIQQKGLKGGLKEAFGGPFKLQATPEALASYADDPRVLYTIGGLLGLTGL